MRPGICTIQRDRGRWITEWCAFHYLVGFRQFYFFAHRCTDNTLEVLRRLQGIIDLKVYVVPEHTSRPQLAAYKFAYENHGDEIDSLAFVDGDEFLFPTQSKDIGVPISKLDDGRLSALAVYWSCFGSSGHVTEPEGLIVENFRRRAPNDFGANSHVKSIVRGGLGRGGFQVFDNSHVFATLHGTYDEKHRLIDRGLPEHAPSYEEMRINHYLCQSLEYFKGFKQQSGNADAGADYMRPDRWWTDHDRNDVYDSSMERFYDDLKSLMRDWSSRTPVGDRVVPFPLMAEAANVPRFDVGRNMPCPCGSGKRFKHCHGAVDQSVT